MTPASRTTRNPKDMRDTIKAARLITKDVKNKKIVSRASKKYKASKKAKIPKKYAVPCEPLAILDDSMLKTGV